MFSTGNRKVTNDLWGKLLGLLAGLSIMILLGIFFFLLITSLGFFKQISIIEFLFGSDWNPTAYSTPTWGILALFAGTLLVSVASLALTIPISMSIAIYLSQTASKKTRSFLKPVIELIASIPSVVLGLIGILFVVPAVARIFNISDGFNAFSAAILITITTIPAMASLSEDAISSVNKRFIEASLALGASRWQTLTRVIIPAAKQGLVAAIMLGLGRIVGETMIVLMVAGNSKAFPRSFLDAVQPMTSTIAIEIKEAPAGGLHWQGLFAIAVVLFCFTFAINFLADLLISKRIYK
jgi:phosphate transport system permease protein